MNTLTGKIIKITSSGNISLVEAEVENIVMSAIVIGNSDNTTYLKVGNKIDLLFKESEVSIACDFSGQISLRNRLEGKIIAIESREVFSKITFDFLGHNIVSLITTGSAKRLGLEVGITVTGLIKANEVMLMNIDDGK